MKHSFIDRYSNGDSFVHRLDPRTKLLASLVFITAVNLTAGLLWKAYLAYFVAIAGLIAVSRVPPFYLLKRAMLAVPFVLLVAILVPFTKPGEVAYAFTIWQWDVSISSEGMKLFVTIITKSWLSMLCLVLLTATTSVNGLLAAMQQMHFPRVLVMTLSFMYRYIFVLADEVMRMRQARDSRNFAGSRFREMRTAGNIIGTLFVRSYERGERVYSAMVARGFDGNCRTLTPSGFRTMDIVFGVGVILLVAASYIITRY